MYLFVIPAFVIQHGRNWDDRTYIRLKTVIHRGRRAALRLFRKFVINICVMIWNETFSFWSCGKTMLSLIQTASRRNLLICWFHAERKKQTVRERRFSYECRIKISIFFKILLLMSSISPSSNKKTKSSNKRLMVSYKCFYGSQFLT